MKIYLIGDSTAAKKGPEEKPMTGWGEYLATWLGMPEEQVVNLAINGRSTKSFIDEGRLDQLLKRVSKDDLVLIQFGHNDEKCDDLARFTAPFTDFQTNLQEMVASILSRQGRPILLTPIPRRAFEGQQLVDTHGDYLVSVKEVAEKIGLPLIDINATVSRKLQALGPEDSKRWFLHLAEDQAENYPQGISDDTHFSEKGARVMAQLIARNLTKKVM